MSAGLNGLFEVIGPFRAGPDGPDNPAQWEGIIRASSQSEWGDAH